MINRSTLLLAIAALVCLLSIGAQPVAAGHSGDIVYVDEDTTFSDSTQNGSQTAPFDTIQEGINHANTGDTVVVGVDADPDVYTGPNSTVVVNKSVQLIRGNTSVTLDGTGESDPAVTVNNSTGSLSDVAVIGFDIQNHTASGVAVREDSLTNFSVRRVNVTNVSGSGVALAATSGTRENVSVRNNSFQAVGSSDSSPQAGVSVISSGMTDRLGIVDNSFTAPFSEAAIATVSTGSGTVQDVVIAGNNASDVKKSLVIGAQANSTTRDVNITLNEFTRTTTTGISAHADDDGISANATLYNVSITENAINDSVGDGVFIGANQAGNVSTIEVSENDLSNNTDGLDIEIHNDTTVTDVTVVNNLVTNASEEALDIRLSETAALTGLNVTRNALNESADGLVVTATDTATVTDLRLVENDLRNSSLTAIRTELRDNATVQAVTIRNVLVANSTNGVRLLAGTTATAGTTLTNVTITENAFNRTSNTGLFVGAAGASSVSDLAVRTNNLSHNGDPAGRIEAANDSRITNVTITEAVVAGSAHGFIFDAGQAASANVTLQDVTVQENLLNETSGFGLVVSGEGQSTTVSAVRVESNVLSDNDVGLLVDARAGAAVSNVTVDEALIANSTGAGIQLRAGIGGIDSATLTDVALANVSINATSGSAIDVIAQGAGTVNNVSLTRAMVADGNTNGLHVQASDTATVNAVRLREVLIQDTVNDAVDADIAATASHGAVSVRQSLIRDSGGAALDVNATTDPDGFTLHQVLFDNNTDGIAVNNASGVVDARYNYWGDSTGPSSPGSTTLVDPVTGVAATGTGDPVSNANGDEVAEVRFSPGIGGKLTTGSQLIDPVPAGTINVTVQGIEISGPQTHFVGIDIWDRSILPLRVDPGNAATSLTLPDLFVESGGNSVSANRNEFAVFNPGSQVTLNFERVSGADTTRYQNQEVQLIVLRANGTSGAATLFNTSTSVNTTSSEITVNTEAATVVANRTLTIDGNGELQTAFTPQSAGTYTAVLTTVTTGDGFTAQDGALSLNINNDTTTVIGLEQVFVQTQSSTVTPNRTIVQQGNNVAFTANSGLAGTDIAHVVTTYDRSAFVNEDLTFKSTNLTNTSTGFLLTINGQRSGNPFFINLNVSDNGTLTNITTNASLPIDASAAVVESGGGTETLTLPVGRNANLPEDQSDTYQYFHAAIKTSNASKFATSTGTITVKNDTFRFSNAAIGDTSLTVNEQTTASVTVENTGNKQASTTVALAVNGNPTQTKSVTLGPGQSTTVSFDLSFSSTGAYDITIAGLTAGTIDVSEETTTAPSAPPADDEPSSQPNVRVTPSANGASVTIRQLQSGQTVTLDLPDLLDDGTGLRRIRFTARTSVSNVQISVSRPQTAPPSDTPALETATGEPTSRYIIIQTSNIRDSDIQSVEFDFQANLSRFPTGTSPGDIALYRYENGQWNELPTTYNPEAGEYTAVSPGFSVFAIGLSQDRARFDVRNPSLSSTSLTVGEETTASVTVENVGNESGTFTANLAVDGTVTQSKNVTLAAGESTTIEFTLRFEEPGTYDITVAGADAGTVNVEAEETPMTPTTPDTTTAMTEAPPEDEGGNLPVIIAVIIVLLLAAGGVYYFTQQRP